VIWGHVLDSAADQGDAASRADRAGGHRGQTPLAEFRRRPGRL